MNESVFIQFSPKSQNLFSESFLDLDFVFDLNDQFNLQSSLSFIDHDSQPSFQPIDILSDSFENRNQNTNLSNQNQFPNFYPESDTDVQLTEQKRQIAKSKKTKNICFNICQKTVKIMKTRLYNSKLEEISSEYNITTDKVIQNVLKIKKDLTGPKALQMFVESSQATNQIFKKFMKWFLEEKYLRHAINEGTMDDLKGYLEFKNQVILNILEK